MSERTCSDCPAPISKMSRTGRCWDCYQASRANAPSDAEVGSAKLLAAINAYVDRAMREMVT